MIKCLFSYETSHYVVYLEPQNNRSDLSFQEFKKYLISHYNNLISNLKLNFENDRFEIYDLDFDQFVIVDKCTRIKNLSKLRVIKTLNGFGQIIDNYSNISKNSSSSGLKNQSIQNDQDGKLSNIDTSNESNIIDQLNKSIELNKSSELNKTNEMNESNKINQANKNNSYESNKINVNCSNTKIETDKIESISLHSTKNNSLSNQSKIEDNLINGSSKDTPINISLNKMNTKSINSVNLLNVGCQTAETEKRIIHLKDNPFKENCLKLKTDYNRLIEENKRLNAKLELYKQGSVANTTNYLDDFVYNADTIERLEKELKEAKEEQKTIMEAFKKKSKEFRRVVYLLTGFKFDALEQRKYRVSHIYSNPNDYLFFTFEKEDVINLLANEFSEKFYNQINTYLVEHGSYPSFLASITIKLFKEKQENLKKELN